MTTAGLSKRKQNTLTTKKSSPLENNNAFVQIMAKHLSQYLMQYQFSVVLIQFYKNVACEDLKQHQDKNVTKIMDVKLF